MRLTPFTAVFGFLLLSGLWVLVMGSWSNGVVYAWLTGVAGSAIAIGLLWTTHRVHLDAERRHAKEGRRREYDATRSAHGDL